jgi:hypothetical protein
MVDDRNKPERPRLEPEIIPPGHARYHSAWHAQSFAETNGTHRIYMRRLGPFGGILLLAAIVVVALIALLAFVGALLLWVPLLALVLLIAAVSGLLRARRW